MAKSFADISVRLPVVDVDLDPVPRRRDDQIAPPEARSLRRSSIRFCAKRVGWILTAIGDQRVGADFQTLI
jgi:hypothetical protein